MENSNDDGDEEEEVIVYANFEDGAVSNDILRQPDLKFKVIGLDSDTPIVQLGETTFKGSWSDTIGTKVFFEDDPSPEQVDPVFTVVPSKMLKYKCKTNKTLDLSRIFLKPKATDDQKIDASDDNLNREIFSEGEMEEESEVRNLVDSTVTPNKETDSVMKGIVFDSVMEVSE